MLNKMLYNSVREGHLKGDLSIQKVTARKDVINGLLSVIENI